MLGVPAYLIGLGALAVILILLPMALITSIRNLATKVRSWVRTSYELSLHEALSEFRSSEYMGRLSSAWLNNVDLIVGLRLYLLPGVRAEILKLHETKEEKGKGVIKIVTPVGSNDEGPTFLDFRPWRMIMLDDQGRQIGERPVKYRRAFNSYIHSTFFQDLEEGTTLLIRYPNGEVAKTIERKQVLKSA